MNATQNDWERILDEAESLYKIRRRGCDMEPGEYAWCRRYLPPTRAEWQRRVEALIARLRRNHPCGGALAVSIGDREYNCAEGTLINAAFADGLVCNAEWKVAWEVDGPDLWNTPTGLALETMRDKTMCFLDDAGKRDIADAIERWEPIAVWEYPYRPDVEADPFNPYRKLSMCNIAPEARLWFGLRLNTSGDDDVWTHPLTASAAPEMNDRHGDMWRIDAGSLMAMNDIVMSRGYDPLSMFADLLEIGLDRSKANFWHPHIYALA